MTIGVGRLRQNSIYRAGVLGRRPLVPTDPTELEARARAAMSARAWAYVAGGAGDGATMRANRAAFDRWAIVPRMLRDVSQRDLSVELLGRTLPAPVLVAPVGAAGLVARDADVLIGAAAAELGVPYIFSNQGSAPMEATAAAMGDSPRWYQLYWSTDEQLVDSLVGRAEAMGAEALVVTLDTTMLGWRPQDLNLGSLPFARGVGIAQYTSDPRFLEIVRERVARASGGEKPSAAVTLGALRTLASMARETPGGFLDNLRSPMPRAAVETFLEIYSKPSLTWDDIATLPGRTRLPVLLKGILHPDDARRALDLGVAGIVVSNHGGRQVDGSVAALDALVDVVAAVAGRAPVVFDSGIRSGADVVKAVALGATAVAVGRPHIYGLALAGQAGVRAVLENIIGELDLTLGLSGVASVTELREHGTDVLRRV
ncbi:alpha-hydroxy-acid oxidizing protein [Lapillicoccus sp.]|uniref:alpha-hydroxy-acid oxidizing protein n=1 Tax=Lapillicoccus sp. TaxID=1909287 RepID=UPI0025EE828F|nr:alpha-hydroxy-acid oxidizing protein [Lapillicoccus sp.]